MDDNPLAPEVAAGIAKPASPLWVHPNPYTHHFAAFQGKNGVLRASTLYPPAPSSLRREEGEQKRSLRILTALCAVKIPNFLFVNRQGSYYEFSKS
jgi:hypothetical protein